VTIHHDHPRYPLSNAQMRLWLTHHLREGYINNTVRLYRLTGNLDTTVLETAINDIIRRHDTLRSVFVEEKGIPHQVVLPVVRVDLEVDDLVPCSTNEQESYFRRIMARASYTRFDISAGPLISARIAATADRDYLLCLVIHHLVNDGTSWGIFNRELEQLYNSGVRGRMIRLPELAFQYRDYVAIECSRSQADIENHLGYWSNRLRGSNAAALPVDRPPANEKTFEGAEESTWLTTELQTALRNLAKQERCTLFIVLVTALKALLYRSTGQQDVLIGSLFSGRRGHPDAKSLIGFFVNILLFRTRFDGNLTFQQLLSKVKRNTFEDYQWSDMPFETLVGRMRFERICNTDPLVEVLVNYKKSDWNRLNLDGLAASHLEVTDLPAYFALQMNVIDDDNDLFIQFVYQQSVFNRERIANLISQFVYSLEQLTRDSTRSIDSISLVTPRCRSLLPNPAVRISEVKHESVIARFLYQAAGHGQGTAIEHGTQRCSYRSLAARMSRIVHALANSDVAEGAVVAVTGPRSIGLIVAIVGVMAAGRAVMPIAQELPKRRKVLMLNEAGAVAILSVDEPTSPLPAWICDSGLKTSRVNRYTGEVPELADRSSNFEEIPIPPPDSPAYVFFTSGTTGTPKGVVGQHKGIDHFVSWQTRQFALGSRDRIAQLTHISFDPILRDLYSALANGGTICIPDERADRNVLSWLNETSVTVLHTVPSLALFWLSNCPGNVTLETLRWVFFSGEPLPATLVGQWHQAFPIGNHLVNLYGATETTMIKCWYPVPRELATTRAAAGYPLPGTQALVMKNERTTCGIGETGEIVIRTPYRTMGYVNLPQGAMTGFRANPFTDDPYDLLYFTGDVGCYRADGAIEIFGRIDDQCKIRGVRVEPDEIANTLMQHESVHACCVALKARPNLEDILVAYVIARRGTDVDEDEIRGFAMERLPEVTVPTAVRFLEKFPRLPNGKIDCAALPEDALSDQVNDFTAPRNEVERRIVNVWIEILAVDRVGIHSNFFDLGGHSLSAAQCIARLCDEFQIELHLHTMFDRPTVARLAAFVTENGNAA